MNENKSSGPGPVHKTPTDLRIALSSATTAQAAWKDLTPLARNEWICWVMSAKQETTRSRRIQRAHRSGDIADSFDATVSSLAPTRSSLIAKGMVWSPNHGDTAFTVPMFDEFMKRVIPGDSWR